ncbi:MAG: hypothetical protein AMXMBFR33_38820 [Candidatus Xenobia bacterium]
MRTLLLAALLLTSVVRAETGQELFDRHCQVCHGPQGEGNGPGAEALDPPPRDLTMRPYKYGCGRRPILRTITEGVSGTAMPSFAKVLSPGEIEQLADFVFKLSRQKGCGCKNR